VNRAVNCYDNAVMESFFDTLKAECVRQPFASREEAHTAIFESMEVWYNRQRLHSSLAIAAPSISNNNSPFNSVHKIGASLSMI
jgi:putative transposase